MTTLQLALLLALAAPATPARNARPAAEAEVAPAASSALSDAEVARRVRSYLATIDTPISAARWRALGPRAVPWLESVVADRTALPSRRARSLDALSFIGGDRATQLLLDTAHADGEPFAVRASALRGAGRLLPPDRLTAELRSVLEGARHTTLRAAAAEVLARRATGPACGAVRAQVARERPRDRGQFSAALERCGVTP